MRLHSSLAQYCAFFFYALFFFAGTLQAQDPVTYERAFPNLRFNFPTEIQNADDGSNRLFVVEQPGQIKVFENNEAASASQTFLDIRNLVSFSSGQEIGLLGLAFHPNYRSNGYFYVYHTRSSNISGVRVEIVLARYKVSSSNPNRADSNSRLEIFSFDKNQNNSNHNGGKIGFGPDGYLYVSVGDGGGGGDPRRNAQNLGNIFGKILRIDVDLDGNNPIENNPDRPNGNYEIPSDNPRVGRSGLDELYAWGIRNTWKFAFDPPTGRLWGADVGQNGREEINLIRRGGNYGWNRFEGNRTYSSSISLVTSPDIKPVLDYNRNNGDVSITGGYVYRGSSNNSLIKNKYIFGDFASGRVWALTYNSQNGNASRRQLFRTNGIRVSSFGQDEQGELYFSGYDNSSQIYKITAGNGQNPGIVTPNGVGSFKQFQDGTSGIVDALATAGNTTYVAGQLTRAGNTEVNNIFAYIENEGYSTMQGGANGRVSALAADRNGNIYAGGNFTRIGGVAANNIAVWNGTTWSAMGQGTNGPVAKIGIDGNNVVYVGGAFENAGGVKVDNIAQYQNGSWQALIDSGTNGAGTNNEIRSIAFDSSNNLYVGGNFDTAGGRTANRIAVYDGSRWSTLGVGTSGFIQAIAVTNNYVYAGGNFSTAGGNTVNRLARWNRSSNRWEKLGNGVSGNVNAISTLGNFVYVAGNFETVNTSDNKIFKVNNIARWSGQNGWQALGRNKTTGTNNQISSILPTSENSILVGGNFGDAGAIKASNVAVWSNGTTDNTIIKDGAIYEMQPQHNTALRLQVRSTLSAGGDKVADGVLRNPIPAQRWKFISQGNNLYKIEPQSDEGLRLDVDGGKTANNTEIHIFRDNGGQNQLWEAIPIGSTGLFRFAPQNAPANRLDIENVNGVPRALSRRLDNGNSQRWKLLPIEQTDPSTIDTSIVYELEPQHDRRLRLDVRGGGNSANSTLVDGYPRHGRANQQWKFIPVGQNIYEIEPQNAQGKRLGVAGASNTSQNAPIDIYDDLNQNNQRWKAIPIANTELYRFEPVSAPGKRLDIERVNRRNRALSRNLDNGNSQRWRLVPSDQNKLIDPFNEEFFSIYPNPIFTTANISLNIADFEQGQLKITNISGKVVKIINFTAEQASEVVINKQGLAPGTYVCSLRLDGALKQTEKMIVK